MVKLYIFIYFRQTSTHKKNYYCYSAQVHKKLLKEQNRTKVIAFCFEPNDTLYQMYCNILSILNPTVKRIPRSKKKKNNKSFQTSLLHSYFFVKNRFKLKKKKNQTSFPRPVMKKYTDPVAKHDYSLYVFRQTVPVRISRPFLIIFRGI